MLWSSNTPVLSPTALPLSRHDGYDAPLLACGHIQYETASDVPGLRPPTQCTDVAGPLSASDFYRGPSPTALASSWWALFKVSLSVAQSVAHKFVKLLEDVM
ncbi:hypothetical protein BG000_004407, partial [Podila horticola]